MGLSSSSLKKIMIGFEIRINNREPVIITSYDVAFVMVNCNYSFDDNIYIGGTDTLSRLVWVDENLKIGDKVVIKVVEISKVSPPMKGLIVKSKDKTCKAGIPQCGVGIVANITWHSGLTWTLSGLKMPEEIHLVWNGGMLEIGDVVEVEIAEFDEASTPVAEDKHCCLMEEQSDSVDESKDLEHKLNLYYRLKKILEDENLIEVVDD